MAECATITIDKGNKIIKVVWSGKPSYTDIEDACNKVEDALKSFAKGEPLLLGDARNVDMRFLPVGADALLAKNYAFSNEYCRKVASLVSSLMLEKQLEKSSAADSVGNFKMFDNEQEAMKWLLGK